MNEYNFFKVNNCVYHFETIECLYFKNTIYENFVYEFNINKNNYYKELPEKIEEFNSVFEFFNKKLDLIFNNNKEIFIFFVILKDKHEKGRIKLFNSWLKKFNNLFHYRILNFKFSNEEHEYNLGYVCSNNNCYINSFPNFIMENINDYFPIEKY